MPDTTCHMSISLDGFVAGPDQSREDPLGRRGRELHGWHIGDPRANDADKIANEWLMRPRGAYVMGRNMFGPIRGNWGEDWSRPSWTNYGLALESVVRALIPAWQSPPRHLRVKLSHDIDEIGIPYSPRDAAVQLFARRRTATGLRDLVSGVAPVMPGSLLQVTEICRIAESHGLRSALYWKTSGKSPHDSGYSLSDPRVAGIIAELRHRNIEMGVHPGYDTFLAPVKLREEADRCRRAIGQQQIGGRQHYLRWHPHTWAHWEQCGLAYDSTLGYADRPGFRAGTCIPYQPWLWDQNRRANLLEIPLILMDRTLTSYMRLTPDQSLAVVSSLKRRCQAVGGVLTLLWHNNCLGRPFSAYYPRIFAELSGSENYDWRANAVAPGSQH